MKKAIYLLAIVALATACKTEPQYVINGSVNANDSTMLYLQKRAGGVVVDIDSALVTKGTFKMKGVVEYPQMVMLGQKGIRGGKMFFVENSQIYFAGQIDSLYTASVTGSASQAEYEAFLSLFDESNKILESLYSSHQDAFNAGNQLLTDSLEKEINAVEEKENDIKKNYIIEHPASYVTPTVLNDISYNLEASEMESMLNSLDTTLNKVSSIAYLKEKVVLMKAVEAGQKAPDFTLNDVNGTPVALSSKFDGKTKLLLVDFWASWCGPCRGENPNVVKVWKDYNKKGFDVFGVSLDKDGESWKKAIADDNLTWTHVSDLQYWNSAAAKLYAISAIPSNFLLDENGVIIAHNLRGEELYNKVKEILDAKK